MQAAAAELSEPAKQTSWCYVSPATPAPGTWQEDWVAQAYQDYCYQAETEAASSSSSNGGLLASSLAGSTARCDFDLVRPCGGKPSVGPLDGEISTANAPSELYVDSITLQDRQSTVCLQNGPRGSAQISEHSSSCSVASRPQAAVSCDRGAPVLAHFVGSFLEQVKHNPQALPLEIADFSLSAVPHVPCQRNGPDLPAVSVLQHNNLSSQPTAAAPERVKRLVNLPVACEPNTLSPSQASPPQRLSIGVPMLSLRGYKLSNGYSKASF